MPLTVRYYTPFSHYLAADLFRFGEVILAVMLAFSVMLLAVRRWREERRSASIFLTALTVSMFVDAGSGIVGLGRPPVWPLVAGRYVVLLLTSWACIAVIGEARRGIWARRKTN